MSIFCGKILFGYLFTVPFPIFTACQPGNYGKNCSRACSPNCKTCRLTDGLCSCKAGWMGDNCTKGDYNDITIQFFKFNF